MSLCHADDSPYFPERYANSYWNGAKSRLDIAFRPSGLPTDAGFQFHYDLPDHDSEIPSSRFLTKGVDLILKAAPIGETALYEVRSTVKLARASSRDAQAYRNINGFADRFANLRLIDSIVREFNLDDLSLDILAERGLDTLVDPLLDPRADAVLRPLYQSSMESKRTPERFPIAWFHRQLDNRVPNSNVNQCESEDDYCPFNELQRLFVNHLAASWELPLRRLPLFRGPFVKADAEYGEGSDNLELVGELEFRKHQWFLPPGSFPVVRRASRTSFVVHFEEWKKRLPDGKTVMAYEVSLKAKNLFPGADIHEVSRWFHRSVERVGLKRCEEARVPTGQFARMTTL